MMPEVKFLAFLSFALLIAVSLLAITAVALYRRWSDEKSRNDGILRRLRKTRAFHDAQVAKYKGRHKTETELTHWSFIELHTAASDLFGIYPDVVADTYLPYDKQGRPLGNAVIRAIGKMEELNPHHLHVAAVVDLLKSLRRAQTKNRDNLDFLEGEIKFDTEGKIVMPAPSLN